MLLAALPDAHGHCRVIGLSAVREGGVIRVGLLLADGATPAQDAPARFWLDEQTETSLLVRLPALEDAPHADVELEIVNG